MTPPVIDGATSVWAQYTVKVDNRDAVSATCKAAGVPTAIYYPIPLSKQTGYSDYPKAPGGVPVPEELSLCMLSLPMHPYLEPAVQETIIDSVRKAVDA